jgi:glycerol-3-phosphate cytidylyltransferase-like family protein
VPTVNQQQRIDIVRSIKGVDEVFLNFSDYTGAGKCRHVFQHYVQQYNIDTLVAGDEPLVRRAHAAAQHEDFVELIYLPRTAGISSTELKLKLGAASSTTAPGVSASESALVTTNVSGMTSTAEIAGWVATGAMIDLAFQHPVLQREKKRQQTGATTTDRPNGDKKVKTDPERVD